jgi:hypothetical protein
VEAHANDFRALLDRYPKDRRTIEQGFPSRIEDRRIATLEKFFKDWHKVLRSMDFKGMNRSGQVDYILFRHRLERDEKQFQQEAARLRKAAALIPFADEVIALEHRQADEHAREQPPTSPPPPSTTSSFPGTTCRGS